VPTIEAILEILLSAVWEILLQLTGELLLELGFHAAGESFSRRSRSHPVVAGLGIAVLGGVAGLITSLLLPSRIIQQAPVPGASLLLTPVISGFVMEMYGRWRMSRGGHPSYVATFWGGALFAFTMALVRFIFVGN
jgi:hypothetical protein